MFDVVHFPHLKICLNYLSSLVTHSKKNCVNCCGNVGTASFRPFGHCFLRHFGQSARFSQTRLCEAISGFPCINLYAKEHFLLG